MSGKDFIDEFAEEEAVEVSEVREADSGPVRGPDGKFMRAEAEAEAAKAEKGVKETAIEPAEIEVPPTDDDDDDDGRTVPLSALKKVRRELQELRKTKSTEQTPTKPRVPDVPMPTVTYDENPPAYIEQALFSQKTQISKVAAAQQYGPELVDEAWTAFVSNNDPVVVAYSHQLKHHPHPVGEMVKWYQEQQQLNVIRQAGSIEALIEQRLAAMQGQPSQTRQKPNVPPSLAGAGRVRSSDNTGEPVDGFDALFRK
jgi:hypothetical protein